MGLTTHIFREFFVLATFIGASALYSSASLQAKDPSDAGTDSSGTSLSQFHKDLEAHKPQLLAQLSSTDPDQVKKAMQEIDDRVNDAVASRRADILQLLVDTQHYDEAEAKAIKFLLKAPANNWSMEHLQKLRVTSLLKQGKNTEALSAAKVYYNVCRFAETKDAISLVSICLEAAHPEDKTLAKRFKQQQVAWASTTQPADAEDASLGDNILASIPIGTVPFNAVEIQKRVGTSYISLEAKGNLLLFAGMADDAKEVFDQAYDAAADKEISGAIENIARAIRAQNGNVAAANNYLMTVQKK